MQLNDSREIPAPRQRVWAALNDAAVLKACIPGCDSLDKTSDTEMTARVTLKMGPVKASFGGKVTLSDLDPPNGYRITGEGSGGVAGFAKGGAVVRLEETGPNVTVLHYEVDVAIGGKLAQLGARLIDSTARRLSGEFFDAFVTELTPVAEEPVSASALPVTEDGAATAVDVETGNSPLPPKKGWFGRLFAGAGTTTATLLFLAALGYGAAHVCCLQGGMSDPLGGMTICLANS
jgi:carbon monoxide dehydrogenase subunit G